MLEDTVTVCTLCADPEEELHKMPNISQGILDDLLPSQEGSLSCSKKIASSCATIRTHSWPLADVGKDMTSWLKGRLATEATH